MNSSDKKLLVIQAAALGHDLLADNNRLDWKDFSFKPITPTFPAVTCTAQAGFRTASDASEHGMVGNGFLHKDLMKPLFWEQSSKLVQGPRIWDSFRDSGKTVALLFWQQSMGESVDFLLSPAPIHKHHGGMIQDCYSKPADLYSKAVQAIGKDFNLMHYWGPFASYKSSDWISAATCAVLNDVSPDLCMTYLPALDYDLQRHGPKSPQAESAVKAVFAELDLLISTAKKNNYDVLIFSDYAIEEVTKPVCLPNVALAQAGLFATRLVKGRQYPDFNSSGAFAVADHGIAHVYTNSEENCKKAHDILNHLDGIAELLTKDDQAAGGILNDKSGDLLIVAEKGSWLAYPWWSDEKQAPDFATHVDIHNKPGYDPCELFMGWPPFSVSRDHKKIKGTHGRTDMPAAWASTITFANEPSSLTELATETRNWLNS